MWKKRIAALIVLIIGSALGFFVFKSEPRGGQVPTKPAILTNYFQNHQMPFKLGLDLSGGTHLVYEADVTEMDSGDVDDAMQVLRDVVERRVSGQAVSGVLGVLEPVIQVKQGGIGAAGSHQLIVDLPGVTDIEKAIATIGKTPTLDFRLKDDTIPEPAIVVSADGTVNLGDIDPYQQFVTTGLTGRYLESAQVQFDPNTGAPNVGLNFNKEGADLFAEITKNNIGKTLAIFLDGVPISAPTIQSEITGGQAVITGTFTPQEAKVLASSLSYGALPVPIELVSSELIGASLGASAVQAGLFAAIVGFLAIAGFLIFWYRLPGLIAAIALAIYVAITLTVFKLLNVTLSAAAIAGFIISIGVAVDANVLIFERIKEELRSGRGVADAISAGFGRAWFSIRDSNFSALITAFILFFLFDTSFIRGFALTLILGVLISLISAVLVTRLFLRAIAPSKTSRVLSFLFGSGFTSARSQVANQSK